MKYLVIPAYEPDEKLLSLLNEFQNLNFKTKQQIQIVIVNDGSGMQYNHIFQEAQNDATILSHPVNKGKGCALKTAFSYISGKQNATVIVTADADGQHTPSDITQVIEACLCANSTQDSVTQAKSVLVTGVRQFSGKVPLRSRFGNTITKYVYYLATGCKLPDTQCGLRAFPGSMLPFLCNVTGERYEYEMNVLLEASKKYKIQEVPIETVYIEENSSSHFHPVQDAIRIYKEIFKFAGASFLSFLMDYFSYVVLLFLLNTVPVKQRLVIANVIARLISGTLNYSLNKKYVFDDKQSVTKTGTKYVALAIGILALNTLILLFLKQTGLNNLYLIKIVTELLLFLLSWTVQKRFIFNKK